MDECALPAHCLDRRSVQGYRRLAASSTRLFQSRGETAEFELLLQCWTTANVELRALLGPPERQSGYCTPGETLGRIGKREKNNERDRNEAVPWKKQLPAFLTAVMISTEGQDSYARSLIKYKLITFIYWPPHFIQTWRPGLKKDLDGDRTITFKTDQSGFRSATGGDSRSPHNPPILVTTRQPKL